MTFALVVRRWLLKLLACSAVGLAFALPAQEAFAVLEGVLSPGDLIKGHQKFDEDCTKCHAKFDKNAQDTLCMDCHKEDIRHDVQAGTGYHGRLKPRDACRTCHTDHKGRDAKIVILSASTFDHRMTDFALKGAHVKVECQSCHDPKKKFRDASDTCIGCHKKDDKHKTRYGVKCESCHNEVKWKEITFDHDRDTKYALKGKHVTTKCDDCHKGDLYKDKLQSECIACHKKDDKHKGQLGPKCQDCHTERSWKEQHFDHDKTKFPLRGKHINVECKACHKDQVNLKNVPSDCYGCHKKDDKHKSRYGVKCETCHVDKSWKTITFDHDKDTKYPLRGKHVTTKCDDCHKGDLYKDKLQTACVACHKKDDKHKGTLGDKCEVCHVEKDWKDTKNFDHDKTRFPLLGKHKKTECKDCHKSTNYKDAPRDCYSCHQKDDKHNGQSGKRCEQCHVESDWKTTTKFDHGLTRFPLLGKHVKVECKKCHDSLQFRDAKLDCLACHEKDDKHKRKLGPQCELCHNARDWKIWDFDHDKRTKFVLDGGHKGKDCYACHKNPVDKRPTLSMACVSCHARDDVHEGSFGRQCEQCHVTSKWATIRSRIGRTASENDGRVVFKLSYFDATKSSGSIPLVMLSRFETGNRP